MGTVFSLDLRLDDDATAAVADVVALLHRIDRVFSTYRPDSDVSRLMRGELRLPDADPSVAEVFDLCATARRESDGWFSPLVGGRIDPTGLVKGWAVERAAALLLARGISRFCLNGGGDVRVAAGPDGRAPWQVGIADPRNPAGTAAVVELVDGAVATSGTAERGRHIIDPHTGRPTHSELLSATVIGPSTTYADAYATACFAMGADAAFTWAARTDGYSLVVVHGDGHVTASPDAPVRL